jgi:hypothetical protein
MSDADRYNGDMDDKEKNETQNREDDLHDLDPEIPF